MLSPSSTLKHRHTAPRESSDFLHSLSSPFCISVAGYFISSTIVADDVPSSFTLHHDLKQSAEIERERELRWRPQISSNRSKQSSAGDLPFPTPWKLGEPERELRYRGASDRKAGPERRSRPLGSEKRTSTFLPHNHQRHRRRSKFRAQNLTEPPPSSSRPFLCSRRKLLPHHLRRISSVFTAPENLPQPPSTFSATSPVATRAGNEFEAAKET